MEPDDDKGSVELTPQFDAWVVAQHARGIKFHDAALKRARTFLQWALKNRLVTAASKLTQACSDVALIFLFKGYCMRYLIGNTAEAPSCLIVSMSAPTFLFDSDAGCMRRNIYQYLHSVSDHTVQAPCGCELSSCRLLLPMGPLDHTEADALDT